MQRLSPKLHLMTLTCLFILIAAKVHATLFSYTGFTQLGPSIEDDQAIDIFVNICFFNSLHDSTTNLPVDIISGEPLIPGPPPQPSGQYQFVVSNWEISIGDYSKISGQQGRFEVFDTFGDGNLKIDDVYLNGEGDFITLLHALPTMLNAEGGIWEFSNPLSAQYGQLAPTLEFQGLNLSGYDYGVSIFKEPLVLTRTPSHVTPVPEPGTMLLIGTGLVGIGLFKRPRRLKFLDR